MRSLFAAAALAAGLLLHAVPHAAAGGATFDDTAKVLAGMQPSPQSPLAALTREPAWQRHARDFDGEWARLDARQLAKVRAFAARNLTEPRETLFYMFSGPDFLYANAFFPSATAYVLSGLERVGPIPDVARLGSKGLAGALGHLQASLRQMLSHSYFITAQMGSHLNRGHLTGTLPVLYVFLARSGKTIRDVSYVELEPDGTLKPYQDTGRGSMPRAVKITFAGADGKAQTLYYFSTNLANDGVAKSGFLEFCARLGTGDSFVKSASYLLHGGGFSRVRDFLLQHSAHILQDDTGVPVSFFKDHDWALQPYGSYTRPIPVFAGRYQSRLKTLFAKERPGTLDFGIGYKWRPNQSNLVIATRKPGKAAATDR
jgi:hypothetical protein